MARPDIFVWRQAILGSSLPPTTRHVLLTLSCHMNKGGESCFPSTSTLAKETGLSERSVITHIHKARDTGWIRVSAKGNGKGWKQHQYETRLPMTLPPANATERGSAPPAIATEGGSVPPAIATEGGSVPPAIATEPDDMMALKEVQSNSSYNSSSTHPPTHACAPVRAKADATNPVVQGDDSTSSDWHKAQQQTPNTVQGYPPHTEVQDAVPTGPESGLAFGDVVQALNGCGTPFYFCTSQNGRDVIRSWQEAGATHDDLHTAISRAVQRNKGGAIGPRYLDPFLKQVVTERLTPNGGHHGSQNTGHHTSRAGARMASLFAIIQGDE